MKFPLRKIIKAFRLPLDRHILFSLSKRKTDMGHNHISAYKSIGQKVDKKDDDSDIIRH